MNECFNTKKHFLCENKESCLMSHLVLPEDKLLCKEIIKLYCCVIFSVVLCRLESVMLFSLDPL